MIETKPTNLVVETCTLTPRPRVLTIARAYLPPVGGMEQYAVSLAAELGEQVEQKLLANHRGKQGLPFFLPYAVVAGVYIVKRHKIDAVHVCDALLTPVGAAIKALTGVPVTASVHGLDITYENAIYQAAVSRGMRAMDRVIAVSTSTAQLLAARWPELAERVTVVPNGVELPDEPMSLRLPDSIEKRLQDCRVVLTTGRLIKRKGVAWFIREVLPRLPDEVVYAVAGDGVDRPAVDEAVAVSGQSRRVLLLGRVSEADLHALYRRADVFAMPNIVVPGDVEGFGLVALEAAGRGLPVVAADLQGIPEAIQDGQNGVLVAPQDSEAWVQRLQEVLDLPPAERKQLGARFQEYTQRTFSWELSAAGYAAAINDAIAVRQQARQARHEAKRSHAVLDQASRERKAKRIIELLEGVTGNLSERDVLDIGTGSGFIASHLAKRSRSLVSVDVNDERQARDFDYIRVDSEYLPCETASVDVVVSNHVVEHVNDQRVHLQEVARVLRPGGICYFTTPNRWRVVEPHFKLPFLSWLPKPLRDPYVRLAGKGNRFDVQPLTYSDVTALARSAELCCEDLSPRMVELSLNDHGLRMPRFTSLFWPLVRQLLPTSVVVLSKRDIA